MTVGFFLFILVVGLIIYYLKNSDTRRPRIWNLLFIANVLIFLSPLIHAYLDAWPDGNMWSDIGSGAVLWLYLLLVPVCVVILAVLMVLRPKFMAKKMNVS